MSDTIKTITSVQNPLVKKVLTLKEKSRTRKKEGLFVIEGKRELELARKGDYTIETVLICPDIFQDSNLFDTEHRTVHLSKKVYEKLAHRSSTEGIVAIAKTKKHELSTIEFGKNPLILVAEAPEKPGNIGAILRTADAAGLDAVLIANPKSDLYNPNIVRSSVGTVFTNQIAFGSTREIIDFLKEKNVSIFCAALSASKNYLKCDYTRATAIVLGTESTGLSEEWLMNSHENIIIPMNGAIDSMNVSVTSAILIFEALRQKNSASISVEEL